ncbi:MAG: hypothetical protein JJE35_01355 [Thermoleophilia bacterium]|nr:hypothetical protein [Thermoleophilia bacterium]
MPDSPGKERTLGWLLLGAAMAVAVALLFWLQRDLAYADDGFNWLALSGLGSDEVLLQPYGGHLIFTPLLLFKAVLEIAGTDYAAFGAVQVALLLTLSGLLYVYGRRRVGPLLALAPALLVLFLGASWNVMLQPTLGIQFLCALTPGLAGLVVLERDDRKGDIAACLLFVLACWGFEMGFGFVVGAAVTILWRDDRWRRIWIVAIPFVIYGIWKLWATKFEGSAGLEPANLLWAPAYFVDSFGVISVSLFGLSGWVGHGQLTALKLTGFDANHFTEGIVILILGGLAVFFAVRRLRRRGPLPASFWAAVAVLATIWLEQALALSLDRTPGETRYIFPGTVAFLLVVLELARGVRVTRLALVVGAALLAAALVGNASRFQEGRDLLARYSGPANAAIAAIVLGGDSYPPGFNSALEAPEAFPPGLPAYVGAGSIQAIAVKYGNPGFSVAELEAQPEEVRRAADIVAAHGLGVHTAPAGSAGASCRPAAGAGDSVTLPSGGAILASPRPSPLLARRFADEFVIEVGEVAPGQPTALAIPSDSTARPWVVQAPDSGGLTACPL